MGCKYACTCSGICVRCSRYQREGYYGEAEDLLAQEYGYPTANDWIEQEREEQVREVQDGI